MARAIKTRARRATLKNANGKRREPVPCPIKELPANLRFKGRKMTDAEFVQLVEWFEDGIARAAKAAGLE